MTQSAMQRVEAEDARAALLEALRARSQKAMFVSELRASLQRLNVAQDDFERALSELEASGAVVMREHSSADPHMAGADLRVVALVDHAAGEESQLNAIRSIEQVWQQWLGEFFASHRCS